MLLIRYAGANPKASGGVQVDPPGIKRRRENGAPGAIPTRDLPLRRRTLYATELREHVCG